MNQILASAPALIVTTPGIWYLKDTSAEAPFPSSLRSDYLLIQEIEGRQIYRRKGLASC